jgi:alanine racemase
LQPEWLTFNANFIKVNNTLEALQRLGAYHSSRFNIEKIGITGSNGKTIVKEWLYQLLKDKYSIIRSPKSFNSQIGVPLSVWQINEEHQLGIFEAGISAPNEMENLAKIIKPTLGVITHIGQAHDENFTNRIQKISEKLKLFYSCKTLFYCKDFLDLQQQIFNTPELKQVEKVCWSTKSNANLLITRTEIHLFETTIQGIYQNDFLSITIPFTDAASIENAITCWLVLLHLKLPHSYIQEQMLQLSPVAMRLELKEGINNCSIINDSYNSDLDSLAIAIDFLLQQNQHQKKTLIISDLLQSAKDQTKLYKQVAEIIQLKSINRLIGVGKSIKEHQQFFRGINAVFFDNTEELIKNLNQFNFNNETILIKGARLFGFERISKILQQKAHETVLEINLSALIYNLNYYRSLLKPGTKVMAMVKAFSYGSGSFEIANALQFNKIDYLAVAYADEGIELRKAGIRIPIMVMNAEQASIPGIIEYNLEPDVYSFRILNQLIEYLQITNDNRTINVHLEIDTGMHRLGFKAEDVNQLIVRLKNQRSIRIQSIFSHLVGSEDHTLDTFTRKQIKEFEQIANSIAQHFNYPIVKHIANSAAIARFPEAHFDMVRLGIGLYGISNYDFEKSRLQTVATLRTIISQIHFVKAGDTVGYNKKGILTKDSKIATIPIGYADGLSRRLSNGKGAFYVNGFMAPVVGNVCMDMTMIDVSNIPCNEGDEVIIFGEKNPITAIAQQAETIPYEILTGISRRVKRVYYQE